MSSMAPGETCRGRGLLLVGHGSHLNPDSSRPVYDHARRLRERCTFDELHVAFWKEEPSLSRAIEAFRCDDITVVPIFISTGYFTQQVIPREMGLDGCLTREAGRIVRYTPPVGVHPSIANVVVQRARQAGATSDDALVVLGHGTPRNPASERNIYAQAARVRGMGIFAEVSTVFLDQEPHMSRIFELTTRNSVVVVPLFVADGWHVEETIPDELGLDQREHTRGSRRLRYAAAVGTHPGIADVVEALAREASSW